MSALFVPDGYTIDTTIKFNDGEVKITYRPAVGDELQKVADKDKDSSLFLSEKLVSWSGMGLDNVPITLDNIKRLNSRFWKVLLNLVAGFEKNLD